MATLTAAEAAALSEEQALLERVHAALAVAERRRTERSTPSAAELRQLREDAVAASEDDSPALLHELTVRQNLRARAPAALPDPRSPYLGHLRVTEDGRARDYLLGHATFIDADAGVWLVDWRVAPVAQLFYRYREGERFEESFPGRELEGRVDLRRVVVIHKGQLVQIIGDGLALARGAGGRWESRSRASLELTPGGSGTAARPGQLGLGIGALERGERSDVTALLDAEQFAAITAPPEQPLLVLGSAGSGKTTVALHRLARLSASEPERFPLGRTRVVVPEEGLARLSRRLLAPLAGGDPRVDTLDAASTLIARHVFGKLPPLDPEPPALVTSLKRHPALHDALLARKPGRATTLKKLRRELAALLTDRQFLGGVVERARGELPRTVVEETVRHSMLQLAEKLDLEDITDESRREGIDGRGLDEDTPDAIAQTIDVDDLPLLLLLLSQRQPLDVPGVTHLVLDEAEDFSLAELTMLEALISESKSVTLAGDEAQQTHSSFAGWPRALETLGVKDAAVCRLSVSYRCPRPVAELAREVLGALAPEAPARASREGVPVGRFAFPGEAQAHLFLAGALRDLVEREPHASVAVICHDPATAQRFFALVGELASARLVLDGAFTFEPGLDVTDVDSVKGLEFDYVVVPDASLAAYPDTAEARRRLHVAVTRTSHQLWLVSPGTPTPLVSSPGDESTAR